MPIGTEFSGIVILNVFILKYRMTHYPKVDPVVVPVKFGSILLLTNLTPHRSIPNVSHQVRWSVDSRYQDASKPTGYQPEAGFLARSRLNAENVVTTPAEFKRVRDEHQPGPGPNRWTKEEKSDA